MQRDAKTEEKRTTEPSKRDLCCYLSPHSKFPFHKISLSHFKLWDPFHFRTNLKKALPNPGRRTRQQEAARLAPARWHNVQAV